MARLPRDRRPRTPPTGARRQWTDAERARALEVYARDGMAEAHRATGAAKSTISGWAKAAGVTYEQGDHLARTAAATATSVATRAQRMAEVRERLVDAQATIALTASALEVEILAVHRDAIREARASDVGAVGVATLNRLQVTTAGARLSEVVGAKTRAVHDLLLLEGKATEHVASQSVVRFATDRPDVAGVEPPPILEIEGPADDDDEG